MRKKSRTVSEAVYLLAASDVVTEQQKLARLKDAAENVVIAFGMDWDKDGVIAVLERRLGEL